MFDKDKIEEIRQAGQASGGDVEPRSLYTPAYLV